jgi:L-rhamnose isomerase/sugar isomerase
MLIEKSKLEAHNDSLLSKHKKKLDALISEIPQAEIILKKLIDFQVAIPSWALGTGGTRFGRFPNGGEPRNLEEKIEDVGLLHQLNRNSGAISLHIPWDIPKDAKAIKAHAAQFGLRFDAMNSNTFQDQADQKVSYKFGSMQNENKAVRKQAIEHNIEVIKYGKDLGSILRNEHESKRYRNQHLRRENQFRWWFEQQKTKYALHVHKQYGDDG